MALSKTQLADKTKFMTHFHIWERDMLEAARRWPAWRQTAHDLGFTDEKIDAEWSYSDAGRLVRYMKIPKAKEAG